MQEVRIIELFAGVGGFRVGLERADKDFYKTVWANQWEPATKIQHAAMVYAARFGKESICNLDINTVKTEDIPDHDMLVGGFPCQDISSSGKGCGISGAKSGLWGEMARIVGEIQADRHADAV